MLCSNCGKNIPYTGKVCPYCNVDKSEDQFRQDAMLFGSLPCAVICNYFFARDFESFFISSISGIAGGFIGMYLLRRAFRAYLRPKTKPRPWEKK